MKFYLKSIKILQTGFLAISIAILMILPSLVAFYPDLISNVVVNNLFSISHWSLFFVMMVRPLADIFSGTKTVRPLVILRKGVGVLSASIIVSFIIAKLIIDPSGYITSLFTPQYWSWTNFALLAHVADMSAIILLVTSNNLSKKVLGSWWKRIQKLSYVYFFGSGLFVFLSYGNVGLLIAMILVTLVTFIAFIKNRTKPKNI